VHPVGEPVDLAASVETVSWGWLPGAGAPAALSVADGAVFTVDTVSQEGVMPDQGRDPVAFFGARGIAASAVLPDAIAIANSGIPCDPPRTGPHLVTGPVAVAGLVPGDVLEVAIVDLKPRCSYGLVSNRHGKGALPDRFPQPTPDGIPPVVTHLVRCHGSALVLVDEEDQATAWAAFPLAPSLGIIGVASAEATPMHSVPPRPSGGNLDLAFLGPGWRLFFAVQADGGLLFVGDPHFAQGDGELALTAVEGSLRATLRARKVTAVSRARLDCLRVAPVAESDRRLATIGLADTLDEAVRRASIAMIDLLVDEYGMPPSVALAYLSAAARLGVSQVVNGGVRGVHLIIDKTQLIRKAR
jgi:acetamidase/formamidase